MSFHDRVRRYWNRFSERLLDREPTGSGARETASRDETSGTEDTVGRAASEEEGSRADVVSELGTTRSEFFVRFLEEHGGRLKQQAFSEHTDWSEPTVSRVLQELEADGRVVRIRLGRENVVCLPEQAPARDPSPPAGADERDDPTLA